MGVYSALLMWSELWAYEIQAIFGGWLGSLALASQVCGATICSVIYMASIGLGGATSSLVGILILLNLLFFLKFIKGKNLL